MNSRARAVGESTAPAPAQKHEAWHRDDERLTYEEQAEALRRAQESVTLPSVEDELTKRLSTEEFVPYDKVRRTPFLFEGNGRLYNFPTEYVIDGTRYRVVRKLGSGGFSVVLEVEPMDEPSAAHASESPSVSRVLKLIPFHPRGGERDEMVKGLLAQEIDANDFEGTYVSGKTYVLPNGTRVYAVLLEKGEGATINEMRDEDPELFHTPYGQLLLSQTAGAVVRQLRAMKRRGWTHRDVKTQNIVIDRQHPERSRLIDHGLSAPEESRRDSGKEFRSLTIGYAPTEVLRGKKGDLQMRDLYALAITLGEEIGVIEKKTELKPDQIVERSLYAGQPPHLRDVLHLKKPDSDATLFSVFASPAMRELARLLYDIVRPSDSEAERLAYQRDHGIEPDAIGRRIESLASEMEYWYKAKVVLDAAEDNAGMFPRWQVRRLRKAFDAYDASPSEAKQSQGYMEMVHTLEDLGFQDALRKHPEAIQDAWRKGIEAEKAAYERRGEVREEEDVDAAAHVRRRHKRRSAWGAILP